ncbi:hypothetical protein GW796_07900 [archaeon]|nr:hypothetical protein [archaeon]
MITTNVQNDKTIIQKHVKYCERIFVEQLAGDFYFHLDTVIEHISNKLAITTNFSEKQVLSELHKKINFSKVDIGNTFKAFLIKNIKEQINNNYLDNIKPSWTKMKAIDGNEKEKERVLNILNDAIKSNLGDDLFNVTNLTNQLFQDKKNLYSSEMLTKTIFETLNKYFPQMKIVFSGIICFSESWVKLLLPYYIAASKYLIENNIPNEVQDYDKKDSESINIVPDFNSFLSNEPEIINEPKIISIESPKLNTQIKNEKIELEVDYHKNLKYLLLDLDDILASQKQKIKNIDVSELFLEYEILPSRQISHSKILSNNTFVRTLIDLQSKLSKLKTSNFESTDYLNKSILKEILNNDLFATQMNDHDIMVFTILDKTYSNMFHDEQLTIQQKLILYKTQLFILQLALIRQSFFFDIHHPGRNLLDFILNNEFFYNNEIFVKTNELISNLNFKEIINNDFLISLTTNIKELIQNEIKSQNEIINNDVKKVTEDENNEYFHNEIIRYLEPITSKCKNSMITTFIERVWLFSYIKEYSSKVDLFIFEKGNFIDFLTVEAKNTWQQSINLFELIISIDNNQEITTQKTDKIKSLLPKINESLSKISFSLNIESKYFKPLFSCLQKNFDLLLSNSNKTKHDEEKNKIKLIEEQFQSDVNNLLSDPISYEKADKEIKLSNIKLDELIYVNQWYSINQKHNIKILHIGKQKNYFIFFNPQTKSTQVYNKSKLWYIIKNNAIENINNKNINHGFLSHLFLANQELINMK